MDATGAPISWSDGASLGWVGQTTLLDREWGDSENRWQILRVSSEVDLAAVSADWISTRVGLPPFVLAALPLPGLTVDEVEALTNIGNSWKGEQVDVDLPEDLLKRVHQELRDEPAYRAPADALDDPSTRFGEFAYALLRRLADESDRTDYFHVRDAILQTLTDGTVPGIDRVDDIEESLDQRLRDDGVDV